MPRQSRSIPVSLVAERTLIEALSVQGSVHKFINSRKIGICATIGRVGIVLIGDFKSDNTYIEMPLTTTTFAYHPGYFHSQAVYFTLTIVAKNMRSNHRRPHAGSAVPAQTAMDR